MVAELRRGQLALMAVSKKVSLLGHLYFSEKRPSLNTSNEASVAYGAFGSR
jgi:hypothetical protein